MISTLTANRYLARVQSHGRVRDQFWIRERRVGCRLGRSCPRLARSRPTSVYPAVWSSSRTNSWSRRLSGQSVGGIHPGRAGCGDVSRARSRRADHGPAVAAAAVARTHPAQVPVDSPWDRKSANVSWFSCEICTRPTMSCTRRPGRRRGVGHGRRTMGRPIRVGDRPIDRTFRTRPWRPSTWAGRTR